MVKGGLAIELRSERARMTEDVDIGATGSPSQFAELARSAGASDLGDFLSFEVVHSPDCSIRKLATPCDQLIACSSGTYFQAVLKAFEQAGMSPRCASKLPIEPQASKRASASFMRLA